MRIEIVFFRVIRIKFCYTEAAKKVVYRRKVAQKWRGKFWNIAYEGVHKIRGNTKLLFRLLF